MLHLQKLIVDACVDQLKHSFQQMYGFLEPDFPDILAWVCRLSLENLANCDALYHDVEHTIMVTSAGQEILRGKHMLDGGVTPRDWLHFSMALFFHDIGYVKGICRDDHDNVFATGIGDQTVELPVGGTDAALAPYHVDRSKLFVRERFGGRVLIDTDIDTVIDYIEMTRFPIPDKPFYHNTNGYAALVRAADFIGQLGDPNYLCKIPALFYELEETGANEATGYKNPQNMRVNYAKFYWNIVSPYIKDALRYLRLTHEGKQWIANLHSHVFAVEHDEL